VRTLLRELVHRSKNLLAVVQAMSRQTATGSARSRLPAQIFGALQALSMAHDLLISQDWRGASMHDLVRAQMAYCLDIGASEVGDHASIDGPKVMLKPEARRISGWLCTSSRPTPWPWRAVAGRGNVALNCGSRTAAFS